MSVTPTTPYDTADAVLDIARAISSDAATANGLEGDILNNDQPYIFPILTNCYRKLQDRLISGSVETFNKYGVINEIPPTQANNPRVNVEISYLGYYDGDTTNEDISLPPDLIKPLELWESISGQQFWNPMRQAADSLSSRPTQSRFGVWDYQNDVLILPGSSQYNDLKLKYLCYAPDLTGPDSVVYIVHAQDALANMLVSAVSKSLGGLEMAKVFDGDANKAIDAIINRTARKESYMSYNRIPFRARGSGRGRR